LPIVCLICASCSEDRKTGKISDYITPIIEADKVTLFSIDGTLQVGLKQSNKGAEKFHDYPILGEIEIKDSQTRNEVAQALLKGIENQSRDFPACFWPRHGIRAEKAGKVTDYVICFECSQVVVHWGSISPVIRISDAPHELLNRLLKKANIPIAP